ncbi:enoyl-CoA hydratase/isomerase family protein [Elongatibacter sediminis]|uniref:Enoyl-CoA hydratase/isomerase family protein n=1 Tax=Elongatibacter sediminis TaxID=3119006 RepID=A0AAW9RKV6_9GAMM
MLQITDHGRVREIRLDRPPVNAMNPELVTLLTDKLAKAGDQADAVVISGRPGLFSAGLDITALLHENREGITRFWGSFLHLLRTIAEMPVPTVFALTGHAPAGGIVISLFGDYRIMASGDFKTGLNEVQVGLVVSSVIKNALVRLVGPHPAENILVPGRLLSPDQALDIGLIDEIESDPEATVDRAIAWCENLLALPRQPMLLTRAMFRRDLIGFFDESNEFSVETFTDIWFSETTQNTLHAMLERLKKK